MSDRKGINKYHGSDFNPLKYEKKLRNQSKRLKKGSFGVGNTFLGNSGEAHAAVGVRLMTPFSIQCTQCNGYIPKFRKFNGKKSEMSEKYLNQIKMFKLSIKCPTCANTIIFRTDPASADYVMLQGGTRMSGVASKGLNSELNNTNDVTEENNGNTVDDVLERLLKQEQQEKELDRDDEARSNDKLGDLEENLVRLQREQEQDAELEQLKARLHLQQQALENQQGPAKSSVEDREDKELEREFNTTFNKKDDNNVSASRPLVAGHAGSTAPQLSELRKPSVLKRNKKKKKVITI
ncbi:hypothetical protein ACO0QE_002017 [Hanseniaspora vineae]